MRLGSEFMPTLNEGTLLYMPTTLPGLSITKAAELLQTQNKIIKSFPEVASVWGKAGRANTATDPAPTEMFETVINLKPQSQWRAGMTMDKLVAEMDRALQFPGVSNAWTMPTRARIDMLATGIRTPVGIKVFGQDLATIESLARDIERAVEERARHHQRLRRAGDGRLLPGDRSGPAGAGPLRPDAGRPAGGDRDGAGGRGGDDDGRGPRALRRCRPLSAALALRSPIDRPRGAGADAVGRHRAAGPGGERAADPRPRQHPHRERPARRSTSSSTSATATSARSSAMRRRPWPSRCICRPATRSPGAGSSNTSSGPRSGCSWWCR